MENNTQNTKNQGNSLNGCLHGCLLGCLGLIVGIAFFILSTRVLYNACYDENGPPDRSGDYLLGDSTSKKLPYDESPAGTWIIENPFYFVHKETTVKEMENWRQTKLIISDDGTFELIKPTSLLAKVLLNLDFELINRESFDVPEEEMKTVHMAMNSSIIGQWSKQIDDKNRIYFQFSVEENTLLQRIQIAKVKEGSIKSGRLEEGTRLHWSLYSHPLYPKEGVVWKRIE